MVAIEVKGNDVTIRVIGHHKIWALKHVIHIKKQHIRFAGRAEPGLLPPWIRCPGTCVPRLICAGTYYGKGRKEFWDTVFKGNAMRIDLQGESYTRIVVDVENPEDVIRTLAP